ncbi:hypothetical protein [Fictibacillus fluitans]|uniref:YfiR C-terminal domain-containing protein n=1 Tax=Fictibacillus fluitans TaxID=3058422 RepID=A0ABT8I0J5_9BACL|nr:hypothetical protein [Fictibacillus sp. NE201]MDN4526531.1 hypothetical protein [Fictibacillus sp. NE201]
MHRFHCGSGFFISVIHKGIENDEFDPVASVGDISRFMISFLDGIAISAITLIMALCKQTCRWIFLKRA